MQITSKKQSGAVVSDMVISYISPGDVVFQTQTYCSISKERTRQPET